MILVVGLVAPVLAVATDDGKSPQDPVKARAALIHKLQSITIAKVEFEDARIEDAIRYLAEQSRAADPDHYGINMLLFPDQEISKETRAELAARTITLNLRGVTLYQAIKFVARVANLGWEVEGEAVVFGPQAKGARGYQTRTFNIPPGLFPAVKEQIDPKSSPPPGNFTTSP